MVKHRGNKGHFEVFNPQNNSNKRESERYFRVRVYTESDKSHKIIYQISSNGDIVRKWRNVNEICEEFGIYSASVKKVIDAETLVGGCLFVKMMSYKTTIDYVKLIKYLTYKKKC